jgi:RNA polymerase sigma-70 factor (ECF subfamily)
LNGKDENELAGQLRAAIAGDEKAYAAFLDRTAALVRGFVRRKIQSGVDPEDIVQETLLAIHLKRHTWLTDAPVLPWIYAIARYKLIDAFRRRGRRVEIDIDDVAETFVQPTQETVSDRDIGRVLDALPAGQRKVVAAISIEGCSIGETALPHDRGASLVRGGYSTTGRRCRARAAVPAAAWRDGIVPTLDRHRWRERNQSKAALAKCCGGHRRLASRCRASRRKFYDSRTCW